MKSVSSKNKNETKKSWKAANKAEVDKAVGKETFTHKKKCACGFPIHTFLRPGEKLEGRIRPCYNHDRADRARIAHIHYFGPDGSDQAIAIRMSRMIFEAVDKETSEKPKLWGMWIKITYVGSEMTVFGHARKIYLVEYDKGSITENFKEAK